MAPPFGCYRASLNPYVAFEKRPDFIGLDASQQWTIVEAKGRSWSMPDHTMAIAKQQTRSLRHINGQLPALRVAVGTYFFSTGMKARVWDPDEYDDDAEDLQIDPDVFLKAYYQPLIEYVRLLPTLPHPQGQTQKLRRSVQLTGLDATLFIDEDIVTSYERDVSFWQTIITPKAAIEDSILAEIATLKRAPEVQLDDVSGRVRQFVDKRRSTDIGQAIDGVTITLGESWNTEYMQRQPRDRGH
jgi:hypothetical protein